MERTLTFNSNAATAAPTMEAVLTHVLEELTDGVLVLDEDWCITYANQSARRISRIRPEDINGRTYWEVFPATLGTPLEDLYRKVMQTRVPGAMDTCFYEPVSIWIEVHVMPVGSGIVLHYRDVTAAQEVEAARRIASDRLEEVLAATTDGVFYLDRDYRITYMNARAREIFAPIPNVLGSILWEKFPPTFYPGSPFVEHYKRAMNERIGGGFVTFYPEPLNLWIEVSAHPVRGGESIVSFFRDVTEIHQLAEARRKSDERTQLALAAANGIGTWDWDVPADLVFADERFAVLYGIDPQRAATGVPIAEFTRNIFPDDAAAVAQAIELALRSGGDYFVEYRIRQPDSSFCWVSAQGRCRLDASGAPLRFVGVSIDITDRKRTQVALIQSEKLAAVGRMASSIAHEINNPLESVTNLIYIARQNSVVPQVQEFLDVADQELRRVSIIANQTLRFHKQSSLPRAITCNELFSTVLSLYEGRLRNSAIRLEKRKRAQCPVVCFEGDIRQVLNNLVGNALDAMPTGGHLLLRSREATDWRTGRKGFLLTVADTGAGMSPATRSRIFEPFFTTKGMNGTGLGLWISSEIVNRHQGRLLLRSSQNPAHQGTVSSLFLPLQPSLD